MLPLPFGRGEGRGEGSSVVQGSKARKPLEHFHRDSTLTPSLSPNRIGRGELSVKSLITGGSGYFGSLLRDRLLARAQAVRVFDLNDAEDRPKEIEFMRGDIRDEKSIAEACAGCGVIFHSVAQVPLAKDRKLFESVNVKGTENVLPARRLAGARKVIYVSSSAVFGAPKSNPVTEATAPAPAEAYGRAKLEGERLS